MFFKGGAKKLKAMPYSKSGFGTGHDFLYFCYTQMVAIAQLVRALDCGSKGRGFEPHWLPKQDFVSPEARRSLFVFRITSIIF